MHRSTYTLILGTALGLMLPLSAFGAEISISTSRLNPSASSLYLAQYSGPPFDGPYEREGPYGGDGSDMERGFPDPGASPYRPYREPAPYRSRSYSRSAGEHVSYHGFRIDLSNAASGPNVANELASIEHQIDIVDSVGLSTSYLQVMRRVPIRISNRLTGAGSYNGGSYVIMKDLQAADTRPVLLHEYMHVLHHNRLPGGFNNPTIRHFYQEAVASGRYQQGSYTLSNEREFFAMTASCFLYGTLARPPYNRDAIRTAQPDYYRYLEQLFGRARTSRTFPAGSTGLMLLPKQASPRPIGIAA